MDLVNIYCDESRFSNPYEQYFLIGCLSCPRDQQQLIAQRLKKSRRRFGFMPELKWQNVTETKIPYLNELLQVFFTSDLEFRCIIVDKSKFKSSLSQYTDKTKKTIGTSKEDELSFYKFYYLLLKGLFKENTAYYLFLDERTKSADRRLGDLQRFLAKHLEEINAKNIDTEKLSALKSPYLKQVQEIKSVESVFIQLLDVLMGSVGYYWNGFRGSPAKLKFITNLNSRLGKENLKFSSQLYDKKWNQFVWEPRISK